MILRKSDWNPDLFYSQHYLPHFTLYRRSQVQQVGGFTADYPGYEDYDLMLCLIAQIPEARIGHVPQILYHQQAVKRSLPIKSAINALQSYFQQLNQPVQVVQAQGEHTRVIYPLPEKPSNSNCLTINRCIYLQDHTISHHIINFFNDNKAFSSITINQTNINSLLMKFLIFINI